MGSQEGGGECHAKNRCTVSAHYVLGREDQANPVPAVTQLPAMRGTQAVPHRYQKAAPGMGAMLKDEAGPAGGSGFSEKPPSRGSRR